MSVTTPETIKSQEKQASLTSTRETGDKKISTVVIVSGGIDSTVALRQVVRREGAYSVRALGFLYGQKQARELNYARAQCDLLRVPYTLVYIPWLERFKSANIDKSVPVPSIKEVLGHPQPSTYIPSRNLLFLTIACQFAEESGAHVVVYGAQLHDLYGYFDTTQEFVDRLNSVLELNRLHRIVIMAPLAFNSKGDNIRLGHTLGVDFSKTYSCYEGREFHCGVCATCAERMKGFQDAGVLDPTVYEGIG